MSAKKNAKSTWAGSKSKVRRDWKPSSQLTIPVCRQECLECFWNKNQKHFLKCSWNEIFLKFLQNML